MAKPTGHAVSMMCRRPGIRMRYWYVFKKKLHTEGRLFCRLLRVHSIFFSICSFVGSTCFANFRFCNVYSWPQNTLVSSGRALNMVIRAVYICSAEPSKNLPQPPRNNVSPVMKKLKLYYTLLKPFSTEIVNGMWELFALLHLFFLS